MTWDIAPARAEADPLCWLPNGSVLADRIVARDPDVATMHGVPVPVPRNPDVASRWSHGYHFNLWGGRRHFDLNLLILREAWVIARLRLRIDRLGWWIGRLRIDGLRLRIGRLRINGLRLRIHRLWGRLNDDGLRGGLDHDRPRRSHPPAAGLEDPVAALVYPLGRNPDTVDRRAHREVAGDPYMATETGSPLPVAGNPCMTWRWRDGHNLDLRRRWSHGNANRYLGFS